MTVTDWETWYAWLVAAAETNEYAEPIASAAGKVGGLPAGEDAPGTDFNRHGSWEEAGLVKAGWTWCRRAGDDRGFFTRPGKDGGVSASAGMCTSSKNGWPLFYCFSTAAEFQPDTPYTRFGVYALLRHDGDHKAAAAALRAAGYGARMPEVKVTFGDPKPAGPPPDRIFKWMSELELRPENDKWLWKGYLSRGGLTVLSALWKAGKSTLLSHLLRACDGRAGEFLGREIVPFRVLYVSEEHEELWAERRDDLGIRDHVGLVSRPFRGRASPAEWSVFIGKTADAVVKHQFDLVVIDTISKMWPVRDENDAGNVEEALMPLWTVTGTGAAVLLVHHNRKSGGKDFTGMRGSGGLPAFAETLIEFGRASESHKDRRRVLNSSGRYKESTAKILIELTPSGYVSVDQDYEEEDGSGVTFGDNKDRANEPRTPRDRVVWVMTTAADPWMTSDAIRAALRAKGWGVRDQVVSDVLTDLAHEKQLSQRGRARSGDTPRQFALTARVIPNGSEHGDSAGMTSGNDTPNSPASHSQDVIPTNPIGGNDGNESGPPGGPDSQPSIPIYYGEVFFVIKCEQPVSLQSLTAMTTYSSADVKEAVDYLVSNGSIKLVGGDYVVSPTGGVKDVI